MIMQILAILTHSSCLESSPVIPPGKHDQCDLPPNCNQNVCVIDVLQALVLTVIAPFKHLLIRILPSTSYRI